MKEKPSLGKAAYEAHCKAHLFSYSTAWEKLHVQEQQHWETIAQAVAEEAVKQINQLREQKEHEE